MNSREIRTYADIMMTILGLHGSPVGVKLLFPDCVQQFGIGNNNRLRYCQAIMKARKGEHILLKGDNLSCPAAASAFGFRSLPPGYSTGKALVGIGIVSEPAIGRAMMLEMPRLVQGHISGLLLFPLEQCTVSPDIVVVEDKSELLMWITLAYIHAKAGTRVRGSTSALQAACVDSTIIPYLENRLNYGYGCHGCRSATDMGMDEAILGFPGSMLSPMIRHLEFLNKKAIPDTRSKIIWRKYKGQNKN